MSRSMAVNELELFGFPRVSGDEPAWELYRREWDMFSPRERG